MLRMQGLLSTLDTDAAHPEKTAPVPVPVPAKKDDEDEIFSTEALARTLQSIGCLERFTSDDEGSSCETSSADEKQVREKKLTRVSAPTLVPLKIDVTTPVVNTPPTPSAAASPHRASLGLARSPSAAATQPQLLPQAQPVARVPQTVFSSVHVPFVAVPQQQQQQQTLQQTPPQQQTPVMVRQLHQQTTPPQLQLSQQQQQQLQVQVQVQQAAAGAGAAAAGQQFAPASQVYMQGTVQNVQQQPQQVSVNPIPRTASSTSSMGLSSAPSSSIPSAVSTPTHSGGKKGELSPVDQERLERTIHLMGIDSAQPLSSLFSLVTDAGRRPIKMYRLCGEVNERRTTRYSFIEMELRSHALECVQQLHLQVFGANFLQCSMARTPIYQGSSVMSGASIPTSKIKNVTHGLAAEGVPQQQAPQVQVHPQQAPQQQQMQMQTPQVHLQQLQQKQMQAVAQAPHAQAPPQISTSFYPSAQVQQIVGTDSRFAMLPNVQLVQTPCSSCPSTADNTPQASPSNAMQAMLSRPVAPWMAPRC